MLAMLGVPPPTPHPPVASVTTPPGLAPIAMLPLVRVTPLYGTEAPPVARELKLGRTFAVFELNGAHEINTVSVERVEQELAPFVEDLPS